MARRLILRDYLSREKLERFYVRQGMSTNEIGRYYDVRGSTVLKLLELYGIPRRARGGGQRTDGPPTARRQSPD